MLDEKKLENETQESPQLVEKTVEETPSTEVTVEEAKVETATLEIENPTTEKPETVPEEDSEMEATSEKPEEETAEVATASEESKKEPEPASEELDDILEEEVIEEESAHDDFDWTITNKHRLPYSDDEIKSYLEQYDSTLTSVMESEIVRGKVSSIKDGDVVLDIHFKSDGLVSLSEFRDQPDLQAGDEVEVYVEKQEDERGQLILSRRKAKLLRAWEAIRDSFENGTVIKGVIISKTKGGLIADCSGLETFLPGSQIDIKPIIDYDQYVGRTMEFKVVKVNEQIKNAVVSHKALIESDLAEQRDAIIASLEKG